MKAIMQVIMIMQKGRDWLHDVCALRGSCRYSYNNPCQRPLCACVRSPCIANPPKSRAIPMFPLMMFVVAQCPMGHLVLCAAPRTTWKLPCKSTGHLQQLKVSSAEEVLMRFVRMTYVMCFTD